MRRFLEALPIFISECCFGGSFSIAAMIRLAAPRSGDLGMADPEDTWPEPQYNPGPRKHLHALGVITSCYNAFEASMFELYKHHPGHLKLPSKMTDLFYLSHNEQNRLVALKAVFTEYEKDPAVIVLIDNLIEYFEWCWDIRNKLVHAEPYPAMFGKVGKWYIAKRLGKKTPERGYMELTLEEVREIADKIEHGKRHCAGIIIFLRIRDVGLANLSRQYRFYGDEPLPEILVVPEILELSLRPHRHELPEHLRKSSPQ